jgi:ribosomal protein L40E
MSKFIVINEEFVCEFCGAENPKLQGSCRNHCIKCLASKHLDQSGPGDRESSCHGEMPAIKAYQNKKKGWMLLHQCKKCGKEIANRFADDDNFDLLIYLAKNTH